MTPRPVRSGLLLVAFGLLPLAYLHGCGGSDGNPDAGNGGNVPPAATSMMTALTQDMTRGLTRMAMLETCRRLSPDSPPPVPCPARSFAMKPSISLTKELTGHNAGVRVRFESQPG